MTESIISRVKSVRKDGKALQLESDEQWYSMYKGNIEAKRGDEVQVFYTINKGFRNISKILNLKPKETSNKEIREDVNASQLTSYAKDIVVELIKLNAGSVEVDTAMDLAARTVLKAYKTIKEGLQSKSNTEESQ